MKKFILLFFIPILFNIVDAKFFNDSASYSWAESAVDKWSYRGIINGYTDGSFRGNNPMTRAELISVVNKLNNFVCFLSSINIMQFIKKSIK